MQPVSEQMIDAEASACPVHFIWAGRGILGRNAVRIGFMGLLLAGMLLMGRALWPRPMLSSSLTYQLPQMVLWLALGIYAVGQVASLANKWSFHAKHR